MLFPGSHLLVAVALALSASAVPDTLLPVTGAAYFITNDPSGNEIISMNIGPNGRLGGMSSISAGGRGAQGLRVPMTRPDSLFSQGSVTVHATSKLLVTVNAGSHTLSMFRINPANPAKLTMVGSPVSSEGEFPVSVAINKKATMVCVLNGGIVNGVNCYTPDAKLGLIAIPNTLRYLGFNQTTPGSGPDGSASTVVFSEDGTRLFAAVKEVGTTPGFLAAWSIGADGSLSAEAVKTIPPSGAGFMFSLSPIPGTDAFISTDPASGFDIFNFGAKGTNGLSPSTTVYPIKGQITTCWSVFGPRSGNFFLTDLGGSTITEVHVDHNLIANVVEQYPQPAGTGTMDNAIASIGRNDFLYVLSPGTDIVNVLSVNTPGHATSVQNYNFTEAARTAGITIVPNFAQGMATFVNN